MPCGRIDTLHVDHAIDAQLVFRGLPRCGQYDAERVVTGQQPREQRRRVWQTFSAVATSSPRFNNGVRPIFRRYIPIASTLRGDAVLADDDFMIVLRGKLLVTGIKPGRRITSQGGWWLSLRSPSFGLLGHRFADHRCATLPVAMPQPPRRPLGCYRHKAQIVPNRTHRETATLSREKRV